MKRKGWELGNEGKKLVLDERKNKDMTACPQSQHLGYQNGSKQNIYMSENRKTSG